MDTSHQSSLAGSKIGSSNLSSPVQPLTTYSQILSAGWGLLPAEFLTPYYDITFSRTVRGENSHERRRKKDDCRDFPLPPIKSEEPIVFFGGKDYARLFSVVTAGASGPRCLFHKSKELPDAPGCQFRRYETTTGTNWHYECAKALAERKIRL